MEKIRFAISYNRDKINFVEASKAFKRKALHRVTLEVDKLSKREKLGFGLMMIRLGEMLLMQYSREAQNV